MHTLEHAGIPPLAGAKRGLARALGVLATAAAVAVGAALAIVFAASLAVIAIMALVLLTLASLAYRTRSAPVATEEPVIEARRLGGHSWVAYGWNERNG